MSYTTFSPSSKPIFRRWLPPLLTLSLALIIFLLNEYHALDAAHSTPTIPILADTVCPTPNERFFAPVIQELHAQGADPKFVKSLINDPRTAFNETLVRINVVGQKKKADYSPNYGDYAARCVKEFMLEYDSLFQAEEKVYGVPKEVIASLLWVETKHGSITGMHHVPSVYLSVAMSAQPEYVAKNKKTMREQAETDADLVELEKKIETRAEKKAKWAVKELLALQQMQALSPIPVFQLYGSWAGAFGWSQFLPSSYVKFAVDANGDGKANLFHAPDAVFSVGHYLKTAGWGDDKTHQRRALYAYNNSEDYVSAILALARRSGSDDISLAATKKSSKPSKYTKRTKKRGTLAYNGKSSKSRRK